MNRRDFLKTTAVFATAVAAPALSATSVNADEPWEVKWRGGRPFEEIENAMLDAIFASAAFRWKVTRADGQVFEFTDYTEPTVLVGESVSTDGIACA